MSGPSDIKSAAEASSAQIVDPKEIALTDRKKLMQVMSEAGKLMLDQAGGIVTFDQKIAAHRDKREKLRKALKESTKEKRKVEKQQTRARKKFQGSHTAELYAECLKRKQDEVSRDIKKAEKDEKLKRILLKRSVAADPLPVQPPGQPIRDDPHPEEQTDIESLEGEPPQPQS